MENNQNNNPAKEKTIENKNHGFLYELGKNIELICSILDDTTVNLEEKKQKSLFLSVEWEEQDKELKQLMESEDFAGSFFLPEKLNTNKKEQGILRAKQEETENMLVAIHDEINELEERKHNLTALLKYLKRQESLAEKEKAVRKEKAKKKKNIMQAATTQEMEEILKIQDTKDGKETEYLWNSLILSEENSIENKFSAPQFMSAYCLTQSCISAETEGNQEGNEWDEEDKKINYYTILLSAMDKDTCLQNSGWNIGSAVWNAEKWVGQNAVKEDGGNNRKIYERGNRYREKETIESEREDLEEIKAVWEEKETIKNEREDIEKTKGVWEEKETSENEREDLEKIKAVWEEKETVENKREDLEEIKAVWEEKETSENEREDLEKTKEVWEEKETIENEREDLEKIKAVWEENNNIKNYEKAYNGTLYFAPKNRGYYFVRMQEDDRKIVAQKLSNNTIKDLDNIIHRLEFIERLVDSDTLRAKLELLTIGNTLKHAVNGIRNMIDELESRQLEKLGLKTSIVNFAEKLEDLFGIQVQCLLDDDWINDVLICNTLYQMIQRICNYIIMYEKSDWMEIKLRYTKDCVDLKIQYSALEEEFVLLWMKNKNISFQNIGELEKGSAEFENSGKDSSTEVFAEKNGYKTLEDQNKVDTDISKEDQKKDIGKKREDNIKEKIKTKRENDLVVIKELILYLSGSMWVGKKEENKAVVKVLIPIGKDKMKSV